MESFHKVLMFVRGPMDLSFSLKIVYIIFMFKTVEVETFFQNIRMSIGSNDCQVSSLTLLRAGSLNIPLRAG